MGIEEGKAKSRASIRARLRVPTALYSRVISRVETEGTTLKERLLQVFKAYAAGMEPLQGQGRD